MEITTTTGNKTFNPPTAKQSRLGQFFRKQARNVRLVVLGTVALGTVALTAIPDKSRAQTTPSNPPEDSIRKITTVIDSSGYLRVSTSWDHNSNDAISVTPYSAFYVAKDLAGVAGSKIPTEKDTIKKIEIPGKILPDGNSSDAVTLYFFPKGALKVETDAYTGYTDITYTVVSKDTIFRNSIFADRDTTGQPVAIAATATATFVLLKNGSYTHFFSNQPPFGEPFTGPKFHSDKCYIYEADATLGENMYRFSKTVSQQVMYMEAR